MKDYGEIKYIPEARTHAILLRTDLFPNGAWLSEGAMENRIAHLRRISEDVSVDEEALARLRQVKRDAEKT